MASIPIPAGPDENDPSSDPVRPAGGRIGEVFGRRDLASIRREFLPQEVYARALAWVDLVYGVLIAAGAGYYIHFAVLHLAGRISAEWSVSPRWLVIDASYCSSALLAGAAYLGLDGWKTWCFRIQVAFALSLLSHFPVVFACSPRYPEPRQMIPGLIFGAALMVPFLNLWDLRGSKIFSEEYRRVIEATPEIRARARLSWELKLPMAVLLALAVAVYVLLNPT